MSIYLGAGSTAHQMSKLYVGVSGTARQVQKVYAGIDGKARLVYQSGTPISSLGVGSIVKIDVGGTPKDFIIVHRGKPSNAYDDSCTGTWVLAKDIYTKSSFGSNNYYESSDIHTYLNGTFYSLLDAGVRNAVQQAKIPYQNKVGVVTNAANGLDTKVFLLSASELNLSDSNANAIGAALAYFRAGNTAVADFDGTAAIWWTRTPYKRDGVNNYGISTTGIMSLYGCSGNFGVRPAMILSDDALVDKSDNVIG